MTKSALNNPPIYVLKFWKDNLKVFITGGQKIALPITYFFTIHYSFLLSKNRPRFLWIVKSEEVISKNRQSSVEACRFLVTRRRFELRTHCLKGSCSACWANGSYGWDGRIWTDEMPESKSGALPLGDIPISVRRMVDTRGIIPWTTRFCNPFLPDFPDFS